MRRRAGACRERGRSDQARPTTRFRLSSRPAPMWRRSRRTSGRWCPRNATSRPSGSPCPRTGEPIAPAVRRSPSWSRTSCSCRCPARAGCRSATCSSATARRCAIAKNGWPSCSSPRRRRAQLRAGQGDHGRERALQHRQREPEHQHPHAGADAPHAGASSADAVRAATRWTTSGTIVEFKETSRPTYMATTGGRDLPVYGRFWVDAGTGTILRTELHAVDTGVEAHITVHFAARRRRRDVRAGPYGRALPAGPRPQRGARAGHVFEVPPVPGPPPSPCLETDW